MNQSSQKELNSSQQEGRKIFIMFLAFFGVCVAVNAFFIYMAVSTNRGVVSERAYEIGLRYNEVLEEARRREHEEQRRN
jgi:nitrogen fixation protein FixH